MIRVFFFFLFSWITGCASSSGLFSAVELEKQTLQDGIYTGEYWLYPLVSRVRLKISEGKMQRIRVEMLPYCPLRRPEKEWVMKELAEEILREQSVEVVPVLGAENSSYFFMQAIQNAIEQAIQRRE